MLTEKLFLRKGNLKTLKTKCTTSKTTLFTLYQPQTPKFDSFSNLHQTDTLVLRYNKSKTMKNDHFLWLEIQI